MSDVHEKYWFTRSDTILVNRTVKGIVGLGLFPYNHLITVGGAGDVYDG